MFSEHLITTAEVAELLSVKPATIRFWVYQRRIPHMKLGGAVRFDRAEVLAWARQQRREDPRGAA